MVVNQKVTGRASSIPVGLAVGLGVSLTVTMIMSMLVAYLQSTEMISDSGVGYGAMLTLLLSSAAGAGAAWRKVKHQRLVICAASGLCYFLSLIAITAMFFGGQYSAVGVTALLILGGAGAVALLGLKGEKNSTSVRRKKIGNR